MAFDANGEITGSATLEFAGETSVFEGLVPAAERAARVMVLASQPDEANFGKAEVDIERPAR